MLADVILRDGSSIHVLFGHDCTAITQVQVDVQRMMPQLMPTKLNPNGLVQVSTAMTSRMCCCLVLVVGAAPVGTRNQTNVNACG